MLETKNNPEKIVDQNLINDDYGRKIITNVGDSGWGQFILPSKKESKNKTDEGLRILVFASYLHGYLLFEILKKIEIQNPSRLNLVGLITDDPASNTAKISKKRRIWRLYNDCEIIALETAMIESGLKEGVPVYTGAVKTDYFRNLLQKLNPDVILVSVFGQIIDEPIINYPDYGIYNFHPADLLAGNGAGPQPFQDLINRDAKTSKLTVHQLSIELDAGQVIGQSPPVNVRFSNGSITNDILILEDKMMQPTEIMALLLAKALVLHKERGLKGIMDKLDFAKHFSKKEKQWLMEPIKPNKHSEILPNPSKFVDFTF